MSREVVKKSVPGKIVRSTSRAGVWGGALLIGLALFLLFRGFGPGGTGSSGSGSGPESNGGSDPKISTSAPTSAASSAAPSATSPMATSPTATSLTAPDPLAGGLTDDEKKALSGDVLTVLIDEHRFLMELPGGPDPIFRPIPLERVVELATLSRGDTNGVKVKILRRETSRASAEFQLKSELERKGIRGDSLVMPTEFVP